MTSDGVMIVSAVRTPIGSFNGALSKIPAIQLGEVVIREAINRTGINAKKVDEVIMGNVLQAGLGQNPARQSSLRAGIPVESPSYTVNHVCGSGLKAVELAYQSIRCGNSNIVVAGGMENMSRAPHLLQEARNGYRLGDGKLIDSLIQDGLWCAINQYHMGITAENINERFNYSREQLDVFSLQSQLKALKAIEIGRFHEEIVPVSVPQSKSNTITFLEDEHPRKNIDEFGLARLKPAFSTEGLVTAGNSSGINDGAAALTLMNGRTSAELGLKPLAVIRAIATAGVDPAFMGLGPIPAVSKALSQSGFSINEIDLIEVNEAFASQALSFIDHFSVDPSRLNVNGGAIALGHPIGASGARILVTLLHEMNRRSSRFGLASLCIGGGQGIAAIVERVEGGQLV